MTSDDKDGKFSVVAPENDAERDAMRDHFDDKDPEPTQADVDRRIGNDKASDALKGK